MTTYRIVQLGCCGYTVTRLVGEIELLAWLADAGFEIVGRNTNRRHRAELQGQPIIAGLLGPMWDGGAIRYEDQTAYDVLSA